MKNPFDAIGIDTATGRSAHEELEKLRQNLTKEFDEEPWGGMTAIQEPAHIQTAIQSYPQIDPKQLQADLQRALHQIEAAFTERFERIQELVIATAFQNVTLHQMVMSTMIELDLISLEGTVAAVQLLIDREDDEVLLKYLTELKRLIEEQHRPTDPPGTMLRIVRTDDG